MSDEQLLEWFDTKNIHNGLQFMSPADNDRFQALYQTDYKESLIFLRDKWGEYADREFIGRFELVHWVAGLDKMEKLISAGRHETDISTQAYLDIKSLMENPRWCRAKFGVLIDGQVTLASNADIQTNQWSNLQPDDDVRRRKYTDWANRLMTNESNCVSPYEFTVGDWKATGIVVDADTPDIEKVIAIANKYGLPIIYTNNNNLFTESTAEA